MASSDVVLAYQVAEHPRHPSARDHSDGGIAVTVDPAWILVEEGFDRAREHEIESLMTIANGYVGTRGSVAEGSAVSRPATLVAGVFERPEREAVPELAIAPDWTYFRLVIDGSPLTLDLGLILTHRRGLDLRQGVLWREWRHQDAAGRITRLSCLRFASLADRHLLFQSVDVTPENYSGRLVAETRPGGLLTTQQGEVPETHASIPTAWRRRAITTSTMGAAVTIALTFADKLDLDGPSSIPPQPEGVIDGGLATWGWDWEGEVGQTTHFQRVVAIETSRDTADPESAATLHLERALSDGVPYLKRAHAGAWAARWQATGLQLEGDSFAQRGLRVAAYHLIAAANPEDERVSIGARALTGSAYKGHVFWDTEIYVLPFFTFTWPEAARALLQYRYHTLPAARARAAGLGYRGALYAWESADTGQETTPPFVVAPDGEVLRILTGDQEHHISADIAYATWQYWQATGDEVFLRDAGAEILLETARFWASRGQTEADGRYHVRGVIGPDEYHETVDDNAYTNGMAAWNLQRGAEVAAAYARRWPEWWLGLTKRLELTSSEPQEWQRLARAIAKDVDPRTGVLEQFEGFFGLDDVDLSAYEPHTVPLDVLLGREKTRQSQVLKQADVVALLALLWDQYPAQVREANFRYYEPRTAHGSSLSPALHALVAARLGDAVMAERYIRQAVEIDLADNMGNAAGGVHIAALGGLWQAVVLGMAGMHLRDDGLAFEPRLGGAWRSLRFTVGWRGRRLDVSLRQQPVSITICLTAGSSMTVGLLGGRGVLAAPGRGYTSTSDGTAWGPWVFDPHAHDGSGLGPKEECDARTSARHS